MKTNEDVVVEGMLPQTPQVTSMNPGFTSPTISQEASQGRDLALAESADQSLTQVEQQDTPLVISYPVEGGVFGNVDAEGNVVKTDRDILLGRGGATNHHAGNKRFRDIVALHRPDYVAATKIRKPDVARRIVRAIRTANPPGRFLKKGEDGRWVDVGDKKAAEKASQALREKGSEARKAAKAAAAAASQTNGIDVNRHSTELHHYSTFPDMGSGGHAASQEVGHSPFTLNITPGGLKTDSGSREDLLPDIAAGFIASDVKRSAEELEIVSPDPKRLRASPGGGPEEVHV